MRLSLLPLAAVLALAVGPVMAQQAAAPGSTLTEAQLEPVRNVLATAQQRLQQQGYHVSPTGHFDAATANAAELYQSNHGLRPTGQIDLPTLASLGIDVNAGGVSTAMLPAEPGQQTAMLPPENGPEQVAEARFKNSRAFDFPIFTDGGDHPSTPQVHNQAEPLTVMGIPEPLVIDRAGRIPGVSPAQPTEDLIR
jgi:peptidoglycan hydrolase-like protein with peptidoglycan-binding domain